MENRIRKSLNLLRFFFFSLSASLLLVYLLVTQGYIFLVTHTGCRTAQPLTVDPAGIQIDLLSGDGTTIPAIYYPSRNQAAIIALGGLDGALGDNLPPVSFLIQAGYGVLQVGSRNCASPPKPVTLGYRELEDAEAALNFLLQQPEVDGERIGLIGFSMGAATAIRMAAESKQVAAVVAEGSYFNLGADILDSDRSPSLIQRTLLFGIEYAYRMQVGVDPHTLSPIDALPKLSPIPVLLIFGERELMATRASLQIAAAGESAQSWIVPGGSHGANYRVDPQTYQTKVWNFFNEQLLPNSEPVW